MKTSLLLGTIKSLSIFLLFSVSLLQKYFSSINFSEFEIESLCVEGAETEFGGFS